MSIEKIRFWLRWPLAFLLALLGQTIGIGGGAAPASEDQVRDSLLAGEGSQCGIGTGSAKRSIKLEAS